MIYNRTINMKENKTLSFHRKHCVVVLLKVGWGKNVDDKLSLYVCVCVCEESI